MSRPCFAFWAVLVGSVLGMLGVTARPSTALAADGGSAPISIWYRSGDGCPDGSGFVTRLAELGRSARLASVGDRVDFVVTLAATAGASSGRLERQTERGTVAIRQLSAPLCGDVAEALALSLELALAPGAKDSDPLPSAESSSGEGGDTASSNLSQHAPPPVAAPASTPADATARPESSPARDAFWGLGARAVLLTGLAPGFSPGVAAFVEVGDPHGAFTSRLTLGGVYREARVQNLDLEVSLLGARVDGCVPGLHGGGVSLQACAALDAGLLRGESSAPSARSDRGAWGAAGVLLRGRLDAWQGLAPEAELGVSFPFVRYTFGAPEAGDLYRSGPVLLQLALGARWSP